MKNIIFDLGGVVVEWNGERVIDSFKGNPSLIMYIKLSLIHICFGILYGNDATETLSDIDEVYGHRYDRHGTADNPGAGYGMRLSLIHI